ncbi:hypothetical protein EDD21DRAFT_306362 [Dissophora ornata]|nr:hypothetical protein BGZ58_004984 [Dissophora ornata]KAI8600550.1 hypothetical protein EDD21DRAFT_306362 [Dissophora ornata]
MTASKLVQDIKTLSLRDYLCLETRPRFLRQMRESLTEIGTFYIKDHGVPSEVTAGAMKTIQDYFTLPVEEKKKMVIGNSRHFRGYKLMGEEITNSQIDHREQLQFGPERSAIGYFVPTVSPAYEGLQGPNQWPASTLALLPKFKPSILEFMDRLEILSQHLMEAVALSLDLEATYFKDLFGKSPYYRLKCARYPSVEKAATIGCGAHKDTGFMTVLLQDMVGGLQGQVPKTGRWMDTRPVPETFVVTMGESIEKLTGGRYHATVHRVLNNTSGQDRYSIPFFFDPTLDAKIPYRIQEKTFPLKRSKSSSTSMMSSAPLSPVSVSDEELSSDEDHLESLVDALQICDRDASTNRQERWSNGNHIFETVQRCHPEVYSRWYSPEL